MTTEITPPSVGAHPDIPFSSYRRWPAVNWSLLSPFSVSPLQGRHEMTQPDDATEDMVFGGAFHTAILEPTLFEETYAIMPDFPGHHNSKAYKELKNDWEEANRDKVKLTTDEVRRLRGMQKAVMAHPTANALLTGKGRNELALVWNDMETGELCKGRIDRLVRVDAKVLNANANGSAICIVDLKKTSKLAMFNSEIARYQYHGQAAFYRDGLATINSVNPETITVIIIAIQDEEPYDVVPYLLTDAVEHGTKLYRRLLRTLIGCRRDDRWPGQCPFGTIPAVLPKWATEEEEPTP
jgi:hypothetical protein